MINHYRGGKFATQTELHERIKGLPQGWRRVTFSTLSLPIFSHRLDRLLIRFAVIRKFRSFNKQHHNKVTTQNFQIMEQPKVFISVGGTANIQQEGFVKSIEDRLRSENLIPNTVGRNKFSSDSPLKTVKDLMDECSGILVIALERTYFEKGIEKRGGDQEKSLPLTKLATPWNQIESAMAYAKGIPIMVIIEDGIRTEGLLEKGYDWYVLTIKPTENSLLSTEFNGVLSSWKSKVDQYNSNRTKSSTGSKINPSELTIGELVSNMKPAHLWSILAAVAALMIGIFIIGQHFPVK